MRNQNLMPNVSLTILLACSQPVVWRKETKKEKFWNSLQAETVYFPLWRNHKLRQSVFSCLFLQTQLKVVGKDAYAMGMWGLSRKVEKPERASQRVEASVSVSVHRCPKDNCCSLIIKAVVNHRHQKNWNVLSWKKSSFSSFFCFSFRSQGPRVWTKM